MKSIAYLTLSILVTSSQAYKFNEHGGFWGWCPEVTTQFPKYNEGIQYKLLTVPKNEQGELNTLGDIQCTDKNIEIAGMVQEDGPLKGHYIGYPGGQCAFVTDEEDCDMEGMVDFLEIYYCQFQDTFCSTGKKIVMFPIAILLLGIAMWNLGSTADAYLSPALEAISDKLSCSESLAGVTLLALGNGAPDVFASIAAGGDESGLNLQVASLIGSSFFVTCVVTALALRAGDNQTIKVTKNYFLRDVIFLLITCVYLMIIMLVFKEFNLANSLGFIVIYVIFVATVIIQSKFFNMSEEEGEEEIVEQTKRAMDYSNLIAFKRQEFKKEDGLADVHGSGVSAIKSIYSKKVPKEILEMNDDVSASYYKKSQPRSKDFQLKKQKTLGYLAIDDQQDDLTDKLNQQRSSNSSYQKKNQQPFQYDQADVIEVQQIATKEDEMVRFQSTKKNPQSIDKTVPKIEVEVSNSGISNSEGSGLNQSEFQDDQIAAYRQSKQGSVQVVAAVNGPNVSAVHMEVEKFQAPELNYVTQKIKNQLKRIDDEEKESTFDKICKIWELPLNFARDYSIPMAEYGEWDRSRASILPLTLPISFTFLWSLLTNDSDTRKLALIVVAILAGPGILFSIYVCFCTKKTVPPPNIMFAMAVAGFIMSIVWISFTSDFVIDLLTIIGLIFGIPKSVLGLTILAVGNCLGDMQANVAMTKLGFGEMAITGCLAGPVFNILMGLGLSTIFSLIDPKKENQFRWSLFTPTGEIDNSSVVPLALICSLMVVLILILLNGFANKFNLNFKWHLTNLAFYGAVILGLCIFAFTAGVD